MERRPQVVQVPWVSRRPPQAGQMALASSLVLTPAVVSASDRAQTLVLAWPLQRYRDYIYPEAQNFTPEKEPTPGLHPWRANRC